jgi:hypothetical protein
MLNQKRKEIANQCRCYRDACTARHRLQFQISSGSCVLASNPEFPDPILSSGPTALSLLLAKFPPLAAPGPRGCLITAADVALEGPPSGVLGSEGTGGRPSVGCPFNPARGLSPIAPDTLALARPEPPVKCAPKIWPRPGRIPEV